MSNKKQTAVIISESRIGSNFSTSRPINLKSPDVFGNVNELSNMKIVPGKMKFDDDNDFSTSKEVLIVRKKSMKQSSGLRVND